MNDRNGIYMPNRSGVTSHDRDLLDKARFRWAVVRTDSTFLIARLCQKQGMKVIVQCPDHWNKDPFADPIAWAKECLKAAKPFAEFSNIICLDNEPNLAGIHGGRWFAEEWTRWYRAMAAYFRYIDKRCHWRLVYPAICQPDSQLGDDWLEVGIENQKESEFVGAHVYWPGHEAYQDGSALRQIDAYLVHHPAPNILVLEYGDGDFRTPDGVEADDYADFVKAAPDQVKACCKFILSGTAEWEDFVLTDLQAERLGQLT